MTESAGERGPIFIVGVPRSGTTLLRVMLDSHPRICCGPEFKLLSGIAEMYLTMTDPRFGSIMQSYGNTTEDLQLRFRGFINGLMANFCRAEGKSRWAEKTPQNSYYLAPLGEIFPDARFIHLLRDGRDVACSLLTMDWIDVSGHKPHYLETMAAAAEFWRDAVRNVRNQASQPGLVGRVLEVRYEALVTEPAATMRHLLAFLGEEWDDAVLSHHTKDRSSEAGMTDAGQEQVLQPLNQNALSRWQVDMQPADRAAFQVQAGDLLHELGYADVDW